MAFIDDLTLHLKAGKGGDGVVRWKTYKNKAKGGPGGGNGGRGGDVYLFGIRDSSLLLGYKEAKDFGAEDGDPGQNYSKSGKEGDDLVLPIPLGSVVTDLSSGKTFDIVSEGQRELLLRGGNGGYGNEHFKSSRNVTPKEFTKGKKGDEGDFRIELKLIADVGIIGLPNAGKSTLLNDLTNAHAKVASYEFTTLDPNLGDMEGFVLADIPGLISGASFNKGLGHKFLKHISRTRVLAHCISLENDDVSEAYKTVRTELLKFDEKLDEKEEIIILTKRDLVDESELSRKKEDLSYTGKKIISTSSLHKDSQKEVVKYLKKMLIETKTEE